MKRNITLLSRIIIFQIVLYIFLFNSSTNAELIVQIDLTKTKQKYIPISLDISTVKKDSLLFVFPVIIPGIYEFNNFGKYIKNIRFCDSSGNSLKYQKINENKYLILNSRKLRNISYRVENSWGDKNSFKPSLNYISNTFCLLNAYGVVGLLDGYKDSAYTVIAKHSTPLEINTSLHLYNNNDTMSSFYAENYLELIANPIFFSPHDTSMVNIGKASFKISTNMSHPKYNAETIKNILHPILETIVIDLGDSLFHDYSLLL